MQFEIVEAKKGNKNRILLKLYSCRKMSKFLKSFMLILLEMWVNLIMVGKIRQMQNDSGSCMI